jgi:hypothetical protein
MSAFSISFLLELLEGRLSRSCRMTGARQFCKNIAIRLGVIKKLKKSNLLSKGKAFPFSLFAFSPTLAR